MADAARRLSQAPSWPPLVLAHPEWYDHREHEGEGRIMGTQVDSSRSIRLTREEPAPRSRNGAPTPEKPRKARRLRKAIAIGVLCCVLSSGCASTSDARRWYWGTRLRDLQDTVRCSVGYGLGLSAHAQVTDFANVGIGCAQTNKYGLYGKQLGQHSWVEAEMAFPISNAFGVWGAPRVVLGVSFGPTGLAKLQGLLLPLVSYCRAVVQGEGEEPVDGQISIVIWTARGEDPFTEPFGLNVPIEERFWVEAGATIGVPSASIGFNPLEFVDFVLGFTTLDVLGDDPS